MGKYDVKLFVESLKEEGIEEIYVAPSSSPVKQAAAEAKPSKSATVTATATAGAESLKDKLLKLRDQAHACTLCGELASTRKNVVFGAGNVRADLVFVGEAPGRDEDIQGLPFVGRAGQLLTKIIEATGLSRKQVFICNTLKCRPPQNRPPKPDEIKNCNPFLKGQLELIQPKVICALGTFAAQTVMKSEATISSMRGRFLEYPDLQLKDGSPIKVMCTYHPAYLLRNPSAKKYVWEDIQLIMKELGLKS